jgi:hypothetical protein
MRNKACFVAQGYSKVEGLDFEETLIMLLTLRPLGFC